MGPIQRDRKMRNLWQFQSTLFIILCSSAVYYVFVADPRRWLITIQTFEQYEHHEHEKPTKYYKLPNIQMIGVQKAGSTAVTKWLFDGGVCEATVFGDEHRYFEKETHFFDTPDRYSEGIKFYAKRYFNCTGQQFAMDATPNHFLHPEKVHATYSEAGEDQLAQLKIILILRDPVDRELSQYNHMATKYLEKGGTIEWIREVADEDGEIMGFDEYVGSVLGPKLAGAVKGDRIEEGFYADNLEKWTNYFDRDQILILSYDEVHMHPDLIQDRIRKFLGVDSGRFSGEIGESNTSRSPHKVRAISCATRAKLDEVFEAQNEKLYKFLEKNPGPLMEQSPFPLFQKPNCTEVSVVNHIAPPTYTLPNIQMIGVQKAGSTAVTEWLFDGGVCRATVFGEEPVYFNKETHFFDIPGRYTEGIEFYAKRFQNCAGQKFTMDATPNHFLHPDRIHATYSEAGGDQAAQLKIILILRNPVDRELSFYNHMATKYMLRGEIDWIRNVADEDGQIMGFDEYVGSVLGPKLAGAVKGNRKQGSFYADNLEKWTDYFDRDQILILSYDELRMNPDLIQDRIRKFLDVGSGWFSGEIGRSNIKESKQKVHAMSCAAQAKLDEVFDAENEKLYKFLEKNPGPLMEQSSFPILQKSTCEGVSEITIS